MKKNLQFIMVCCVLVIGLFLVGQLRPVDVYRADAGNITMQPLGKTIPDYDPRLTVTSYVQWVRLDDLWAFDKSATAAPYVVAAPTWGNASVTLVKNTTRACYPLTIPTGLSDGRYAIPYYDSASPASTDTLVKLKFAVIRGGEFIDCFEM